MKKSLSIIMVAMVLVLLIGTFAGRSDTKSGSAGSKSGGEHKYLVGFNNYSDSLDFTKLVGDSMRAKAAEMDVELLYTESEGKAQSILRNVDNFILQGAQVIVEFNFETTVGATVLEKCIENNIPCIAVDCIYGEESYFFGANNLESGIIAGKAAAEEINAEWGGQLDYVVMAWCPSEGEEVNKRLTGILDGLAQCGFNVTDDQVIWADVGTGDTTLGAKQKATDFLTANPDAKHILFGCNNDQAAMGIFAGVETQQRNSDVIIVSQGCDEPGIANLRKPKNCWIGSTAYFPEHYGDYIIPMCVDLIEGKPVPKMVTLDHVFITKKNINEYYPE